MQELFGPAQAGDRSGKPWDNPITTAAGPCLPQQVSARLVASFYRPGDPAGSAVQPLGKI